ncbi:hypothetical protein [Methylacidimicrobium sp. B4]|uniref:hypothetical protein n=1 Tax=Methylacidimicrobium sp. B4 TaxID=2796139 RepID=UPI001A8DB482|nr:hypothetical protein [Methylacidimicrobium sp. B4]QSR84932.1 hypothetical protein MacB4_01265 [Methylacidimicrobium sp. B4]
MPAFPGAKARAALASLRAGATASRTAGRAGEAQASPGDGMGRALVSADPVTTRVVHGTDHGSVGRIDFDPLGSGSKAPHLEQGDGLGVAKPRDLPGGGSTRHLKLSLPFF